MQGQINHKVDKDLRGKLVKKKQKKESAKNNIMTMEPSKYVLRKYSKVPIAVFFNLFGFIAAFRIKKWRHPNLAKNGNLSL